MERSIEADAGRGPSKHRFAEAIDAVLKLRSEVLEEIEGEIARNRQQRTEARQSGHYDIAYHRKMEINGLESARGLFRWRVDEMLKELSGGGELSGRVERSGRREARALP
jgi:hypothetical protein